MWKLNTKDKFFDQKKKKTKDKLTMVNLMVHAEDLSEILIIPATILLLDYSLYSTEVPNTLPPITLHPL